jgi:conjugative relaxase-like TrwC/TraI family protein
VWVVLSIGTLRDDGGSYYLGTVASGVEDYYVGRGEAPGRWTGRLSRELGLDGQVERAELEAVLDGQDPTNRDRLRRSRHDGIPGFDLTVCAPKSVSLMWALGDPETSRAVHDAHDHAVAVAIDYLERTACWSRRGTNGAIQTAGTGFIGAGFRHRTSRNGDPHLHTHVLVANATRTAKGWGALDGRHLFLHAKTAGYLYQASLRAALTRRLGVAWTPVRNGYADIVGIPEHTLRHFATRSDEITAERATRGLHSARATQVAVLATRRPKDVAVDPFVLRDQWREQAATVGLTVEQIGACCHQTAPPFISAHDLHVVQDRLLGPDGLTRHASTFDRDAVIRAWCELLPPGSDSSRVETLADQTLADPAIVPLAAEGIARVMRRKTGKPFDTPTTGPSYSTHELLALETRLIQRATEDTQLTFGVVDEEIVLAALADRSSLAAEQVGMVATLCTSGRPVDLVIAAAGTGKTFSLDAARDAWQRSGHHVIGTALSARAALELETATGIPSHTLASLLRELGRPEEPSLPERTVIVVDEAGMAGTRQLARVLDHAHAAGAKVVLVGDSRQLPEIDAGGLLRGLAQRIPPIRLHQNRRQHHDWERRALRQLRRGEIDAAVAAYHDHDRITTSPTARDARDAMCADWWAATLGGYDTLMLAARRSDVDDLNERARDYCAAAGRLSGPVLFIDDRPYQTGDRIMMLRNNRRLGTRNGTIALVERVEPASRTMTVRPDTGAPLELPSRYLDAGHIRHSYASTIHKAQGQTVDEAFVLGSDLLSQEAGYVALSRGRWQNRIYLVDPQPRPEAHAPEISSRAPIDGLTYALGTSKAQQLAIDTGIDRIAIERSLRELILERDRLLELERACPPSRVYEIHSLQRERADMAVRLAAHERDLARVENSGGWRHRRDRNTRRVMLEHETRFIRTRLAALDEARDLARREQQVHERYRAKHNLDFDRTSCVERDIDVRVEQLVDADTIDPPRYLRVLGTQPEHGIERDRWRDAARYIESYRAARGITDPERPLGPKPPGAPSAAWRHDLHQLDLLLVQIHEPTLARGVELNL